MSSHDIKLEICVDSIASALAAEEGGANRIELCSALSEGGLTPSVGCLKTLKKLLNIPIYCMLRPRRGTDFVYTEQELEAILTDLELLRKHGADGFVFGALTEQQRTIDVETCQRIVQQAGDLPVTFHRAFDLTDPNKMHENVEKLKEIGFKRLLSSGFRQSAAEGAEFLAQLIAKHHRDIIIMPGAGIRVQNLEEILTVTRCVEFHASATSNAVEDGTNSTTVKMECDVIMGRQDTDSYTIANINVIRKMVTIANAMGCK